MSNQSLKQASIQAVTSTNRGYEGDWHALFDLHAIPSGPLNGRLLEWINLKLGAEYNNLPSAMQALAADSGVYNWDSLASFDPRIFWIEYWIQNIWDYRNEFELSITNSYTNYNPENDRPVIPSTQIGYIDPVSGNDGTAIANNTSFPYQTLAGALTAGIRHFKCKGGWYDRTTGFAASVAFTTNIIIESWDGALVYITRALTSPVWVQESAPNDSVYSTTLPADATPACLVDLTYTNNGINAHADGNVYSRETFPDGTTLTPIPLKEAASVAACQASAGSWFRNSTTLYVHTHNNRAPDSSVKVFSSENVMNVTTGNAVTLWFSDVVFAGNNAVAWNAPNETLGRLVAVDCAACFTGVTDDCWDIDDIDTRFVRCQALDARSADGFSYHRNVAATRINRHLEDNCYAARNGFLGSAVNDNGSTTHDLVRIIRVGCTAKGNYGPNFADTAGAWAINLGCTSIGSHGSGTANVGFQCGTYSTIFPAVAFYKNCTSTSDNSSRSKATGGQFIDLGGGSYQGGDASGSVFIPATNNYMAIALSATDALIGWLDVSNPSWVDVISGGVDDVFDISPNKANIADGGTRATYDSTNALANGNAAINFGTATNSIYYLVAKSTLIKEVVVIGAVEDGLDNTFDASMRFMANSAGVKRIAGSSGAATLEDAGANSAATQVSINNAAASATMLPTGYSVWRFVLPSAQTDTFRLLGDSSAANVGFQGVVTDMLLFNRTLTASEWSNIYNALVSERM